MKTSDKIISTILLIVYCGLFIGGLAGILNDILYRTISVNDLVLVKGINQINDDEYILSYTYFNKIAQKSYIVERSIDHDEYQSIKDKSNLKIQYVGYFPGSPHIERVDSKTPLLLVAIGLVLIAIVIRRNIQFLKGKITAQEFY